MTAVPPTTQRAAVRHTTEPAGLGHTVGSARTRHTAELGTRPGHRPWAPCAAPPRRGAVVATAAVLLLTLLAACSSDNQVPRSFIAREYDRNGSHYVADEPPAAVSSAIQAQASARNRVERGSRIYLRYRRDIVAIRSQADGGSRIEIDSYRNGYRRWNNDVGDSGPAPDTSGGGHRGGGSGSGGK